MVRPDGSLARARLVVVRALRCSIETPRTMPRLACVSLQSEAQAKASAYSDFSSPLRVFPDPAKGHRLTSWWSEMASCWCCNSDKREQDGDQAEPICRHGGCGHGLPPRRGGYPGELVFALQVHSDCCRR